MHVAVGSTNPVKVRAVEQTLERFQPAVTAHAVDSGVAEQPRSIDETVTGAQNRARRALETAGGDYGVGLEGGVARIDGIDGLSLIMWAAVTDGTRLEYGGGPTLSLPDDVTRRLEAGDELGPIMDDRHDADDIAKGEGAAGVLTAGLTNRSQALGEALAGAFGPFVVDGISTEHR
ncbi:inosine/xanthosine triphosphatase [Natronorubrum sediminis]|uniref:Probable inosine/xanthosine triphosphatase n=1 Tax=Natronorubrum sediminis TaxID=640943 RepID=A0A1H6FRY9_9EURY|nr:inosine/xanthosine triphosphatase [Natronorubrum sediminis]SEH12534.1 inosine/xanthosine triphosphatase [Natronorubrum sediminis]